ncbi:hypothetical protein HYX06_03275 [Candidatus Woesearchaeota archaeon]|nr:hypothetical protein [Candidatus Woesearchaeota archaeon]
MRGVTNKECKFCTYRWTAKVKNPKSCPRCKRRFDYKEARLVLEALGREYGYNLVGEVQ